MQGWGRGGEGHRGPLWNTHLAGSSHDVASAGCGSRANRHCWGLSFWLAGAGEGWGEQQHLAGRGSGTGFCGVWGLWGQPFCRFRTRVSGCHSPGKHNSFPCSKGGSRNRGGNPLRNPRSSFSWRRSPSTVFHMGTAVPGKAHGGGEGRRCCGLSVLLKARFPGACGGSKGRTRGAATAEAFLPTAELGAFGQSSVCSLGMVWNSVRHFWSQLLVHGTLVKLNPSPFAGVGCGGATLVLWQSQVTYVWAATWCGQDQGRWWVASGDFCLVVALGIQTTQLL